MELARDKKRLNIAYPGALHKKSLLIRLNGFDASYRIAGDYDFILRAGAGLKTAYIDHVTVIFGANGVSSTSPIRVAREVLRAKLRCDSIFNGSAYVEFAIRIILGLGILLRRKILPYGNKAKILNGG